MKRCEFNRIARAVILEPENDPIYSTKWIQNEQWQIFVGEKSFSRKTATMTVISTPKEHDRLLEASTELSISEPGKCRSLEAEPELKFQESRTQDIQKSLNTSCPSLSFITSRNKTVKR